METTTDTQTQETRPSSAPSGSEPVVTRFGALDMQVCVPKEWNDDQVKAFADGENLCGTAHGWHIRKQGDEALRGAAERTQCADRAGYVHIMLDA
jgi:hypothetical protein